MPLPSILHEDFDLYSTDATAGANRLAKQGNWAQGQGQAKCFLVQSGTVLSGFNSLAVYSPDDSINVSEAYKLVDKNISASGHVMYFSVQLTADAYDKASGKGVWIFPGCGDSVTAPWYVKLCSDDVGVYDNLGSPTWTSFVPSTGVHHYMVGVNVTGGLEFDADSARFSTAPVYSGGEALVVVDPIDRVYVNHDADSAGLLVAYVDQIELCEWAPSGWNVAQVIIGG